MRSLILNYKNSVCMSDTANETTSSDMVMRVKDQGSLGGKCSF